MMFLGFRYHKIIIRPRDISTEEHSHHGTAATMRTTSWDALQHEHKTLWEAWKHLHNLFLTLVVPSFSLKGHTHVNRIFPWFGNLFKFSCTTLRTERDSWISTAEQEDRKYERSIVLTCYLKYSKRNSGFQLLLMSHLSSG